MRAIKIQAYDMAQCYKLPNKYQRHFPICSMRIMSCLIYIAVVMWMNAHRTQNYSFPNTWNVTYFYRKKYIWKITHTGTMVAIYQAAQESTDITIVFLQAIGLAWFCHVGALARCRGLDGSRLSLVLKHKKISERG